MRQAAVDEGWMETYDVAHRWEAFPKANLKREAIAEAYADYRQGAKFKPEIATLFQRIKDFVENLRQRMAEMLGFEPNLTWEQIFDKVDSGEIGARELEGAPREGEAIAAEPEGPEPTKIKSPFAKGRDIGLRQDIYDRYMRLIQRKHEADLAADFGKAHELERKQQTREWRENAAAIREQVQGELDQKPNIALDKLFAERGGQLKIDPMSISEAQRELLPKEYMRRTDSVNADQLASYFGYPSGDALVEHLAEVAQQRKASGLSHAEFTKQLIDQEVTRRMEAQHGWLEKNILEDAKDRALSQNQIDILDLENLLLAWKTGAELPVRSTIYSALRESFDDTPVGTIKSDLWLKAAGKAGRDAEIALQKADFQEAFKAKQRQHNATLQAKWSHEYEKARAKLDKVAKQLGKRKATETDTIEPAFLNHAQDQLRRAGYSGARSWDNIKQDLGGESITDLATNQHAATYGMMDLPVADFAIADPNWAKPVDKLTHGEFLQYKGMVDALVKVGREERKFGKADEKIQLDAARTEFVARLSENREGRLPTGPTDKPGYARSFLARSTSMMTTFNLFDRLDRNGPWNVLARRFLDADAEGTAFSKWTEKEWKEFADYGDLTKRLTPPPMLTEWNKRYSQFTRENLLGLIANAGNKSNWFKTAKGWGVDDKLAEFASKDPESLWQWMIANSTREDWARGQAMGDRIFNRLLPKATRSKSEPRATPSTSFHWNRCEIDFGDKDAQGKALPPLALKGWYHRLIHDPIWFAEKERAQGRGFKDSNFGHVHTSDGWTRARTGAIYPVDLSFGMLPGRLAQMVARHHAPRARHRRAEDHGEIRAFRMLLRSIGGRNTAT